MPIPIHVSLVIVIPGYAGRAGLSGPGERAGASAHDQHVVADPRHALHGGGSGVPRWRRSAPWLLAAAPRILVILILLTHSHRRHHRSYNTRSVTCTIQSLSQQGVGVSFGHPNPQKSSATSSHLFRQVTSSQGLTLLIIMYQLVYRSGRPIFFVY